MKIPFQQTLATLQPSADGRWTGATSEDWLQGRSLFGGLQVAFALRAMRALVPAELPLRTLQVSFLAPVPSGPIVVAPRLLRAGKNVCQAEAQLLEGTQVLAVVIGIFGASRASEIARCPERPAVAVPTHPPEARYIPGVTPAFLQHFKMRWLRGGLPFSGTPEPQAVIEVDLLDEGTASELHLPALADSIPPVALSLLSRPVPGSSMTWMFELLQDSYAGLSLEGWRLDVEMVAAGQGYTSQSALLWAPDGRPAALSRQSMVVFG